MNGWLILLQTPLYEIGILDEGWVDHYPRSRSMWKICLRKGQPTFQWIPCNKMHHWWMNDKPLYVLPLHENTMLEKGTVNPSMWSPLCENYVWMRVDLLFHWNTITKITSSKKGQLTLLLGVAWWEYCHSGNFGQPFCGIPLKQKVCFRKGQSLLLDTQWHEYHHKRIFGRPFH